MIYTSRATQPDTANSASWIVSDTFLSSSLTSHSSSSKTASISGHLGSLFRATTTAAITTTATTTMAPELRATGEMTASSSGGGTSTGTSVEEISVVEVEVEMVVVVVVVAVTLAAAVVPEVVDPKSDEQSKKYNTKTADDHYHQSINTKLQSQRRHPVVAVGKKKIDTMVVSFYYVDSS